MMRRLISPLQGPVERMLEDIDVLRRGHTLEKLIIKRQFGYEATPYRLLWIAEIVTMCEDPHDGIITVTYTIDGMTTEALHELIDFVDNNNWTF